MEEEIEQPKKIEPVKISLLRTSIRGPLVVMVLLLTLGLTTLFYFSQDSRADVYGRYVETISEYKYLEMRLIRGLDRYRYSLDADSSAIEAGLMTLREIAVSVSSSMDSYRQEASWSPSVSRADVFEREVLNKVSIARRYMKERRMFLAELETIEGSEAAVKFADSLRLGYAVWPDSAKFDPPMFEKLAKLAQQNMEHTAVFARFDNARSALWAEDLIIDFKDRGRVVQEWKTTLSLVFYLLSIAMLLVTLLLYVRVKND